MQKLHKLAERRAQRVSAADAEAAEAKTRAAERELLADTAAMALKEILNPLDESLRSVPGVMVHEGVGDQKYGFEYAMLTIESPKPLREVSRIAIPFDIVSNASIEIEMTHIRDKWAGRSHSLWYCDAETEGEYHWYETAFHNMRNSFRLQPYSGHPLESNTQMALQRVIHTEQVARQFAALEAGSSAERFVEAWLQRFAQAAEGRLPSPMVLPEGNTSGSWRN